ncbi:hypothetical protein ACP4OV_014774 [Aristida adscensionis]
MDLVTGAMGNLGPKLLQLLHDEYKLHKGVRKKIKFVSEELESIHGALRKVAAVPPDQLDEQVKIWARQVREASYDMEDILDTFLVRVEGTPGSGDQGRLKGSLKKMGKLFSKGKARRDIACAIEDIKKQLQEVAERQARYKVDEIVAKPATTSTVDPRIEAMYKEVTQLVGIDKAMGELISMMSVRGDEASNGKLKIISVLGVGGLGKTTLVKAVHDKLKPQFHYGAFVPVGRNPDLKKVFRDILIDLDKHKYTDPKITMLDERQLINELREFLLPKPDRPNTKRYFIVIDDVWEIESWERIQLAFVDHNNGSRVISTTRKFEVTNGEVYKLQPLSYVNSKRLFYTRMFDGKDKCHDNEVDEVSDKILKKCGGIPLAIITMASLLVGKSREEWSEVCSSTSFFDKDIKQVDTTMWILSLSYYDLPCHLRTCLLYLSTFPEDYVIDKHTLIWKWVAEGFVHKKPGTGLFEVGEGYFNDLINRSMIQPVVVSEEEHLIHGCRVHDMVLDLLCSLSREENFITVSDNYEATSWISSARRLACQNRIIEHTRHHLGKHMGMPKLRSFIAHSCRTDKRFTLLRFKLLRVLSLEDIYRDVPLDIVCIGSLLHLRYLGLRNTSICELPEEIGGLKFLQTLVLEQTGLQKLPSSIGQLTQLVCLRAEWMSVQEGIIKKLTSLEELRVESSLYNMGHLVKELGNLSELRVLWMVNEMMEESMQSDILQSISNLPKIQSLTLVSVFCDTDLDKSTCDKVVLARHVQHLFVPCLRFSQLPPCINPSSLPDLTHLNLRVTAMDEQGLKVLGKLSELRYLELSTDSSVTVANIATDGFFEKLRFCNFCDSMIRLVLNEDSSVSFTIWNGIGVMGFASRKNDRSKVAPAVMPNLEELCFKVYRVSMTMTVCKSSCDNLGLEYITSLQKVTVNCWCSSDAKEAESALRHNHPTLDVRSTHTEL